ncbi:MAG TPA: glycosyltransferase family 2 protein [Chitinophagaceae bacterium]|nr:glycosyltransferase family 2 protein [Chitinophagaceae bacterium]
MVTEDQPLVSIITLNYNQTDVTCEFLESSRKLTYPRYEILVCDMGSSINPEKQIGKGNYPNVRVLVSERNLGFTGGNNWGMRQANGTYLFIVNNDTELTADLIEQLLEPFRRDTSIGVTCPKIRYFQFPDIIQYAGFNPINVYTGRTTAVGSMEEDKGQYDIPGPTFGAHGCAMMVKKEVIDQVGMFPENFFIYYEEWDWSSRILRGGFKIYYQPRALIYHKESVTMGKKSAIKVYYHTRNRILYMRRNSTRFQFFVFFVFFTLFTMPKTVVSYAFHRQFGHLRSFLKGTLENFHMSSYSPL